MCVECCWCLCIHKVSFRGASYFFASVHGFQGVSSLLHLIFQNVLLRTYLMDSRKTDLDMPEASADTIDLLSKSLYYLATTVTALLIFRGIEKEWRNLIQWSAVVFLTIEAVALSTYFLLHPEFYNSATCILALSSRAVFVFFYMISLTLYVLNLIRDEDETEWKFQHDGFGWEPRFLTAAGRNPGGIIMNGGFGTLGFGENTTKWLQSDFNSSTLGVSKNPSNISNLDTSGNNYFSPVNTGTKKSSKEKEKEKEYMIHEDEKFEVRYEVCKSSGKV